MLYESDLVPYIAHFTQRGFDEFEDPVDARRVYAVSDLHVDNSVNFKWLENLRDYKEEGAALIVAGDVGTKLETLETAFAILLNKFVAVWFVVGNHELWMDTTSKAADSVQKFFQIMDLCKRMGVRVGPGKAGKGVTVVPLLSWWKLEFSQVPMVPALRHMDSQCKWPELLGGKSSSPLVADFFLRLNQQRCGADYGNDDIISFSHFLPKPELFYGRPFLARIMGCHELGEQVASLKTSSTNRLHVFGHSHMNYDRTLCGIRWIALQHGMPRERQNDPWGIVGADSGPKLIWTSLDEDQSNLALTARAVEVLDFGKRMLSIGKTVVIGAAASLLTPRK
mmetsp:Transcript_29954/g.57544  ORF Transcript_29954/g.57544 Transcript_29954/m.57544 type:complete len:338 (-) Transcript_29954:297-1310(-)|eukprot:CAMPEP_0114249108 /NCGR_PEP_ID=MMETSP0058-20121206/13953_1 /TAXON_ID=36894 /ORGANISM="Pyramimonas parkeae, CCMP726" /LENGTH=337 /DNA_ID=CAMNT_0001362605 /DNA_START=56 /DNA_END=1069 /DNA_ORIENTATION=-